MSDGRPNIAFVLCDNVGWGDFACYGGGTPTPRIDKLASEGIRFNNYNLFNTRLDMTWMAGVTLGAGGEFEKSLAQYPNIKPGEEFTGYKAKPGS